MSDFLFIALCCVAGAIVLRGLVRPGGYLRYPFLCGALYLGWVAPQLWTLKQNLDVPDQVFADLVLMALACLAATILGWFVGVRPGFRIVRPVVRSSGGSLTLLQAVGGLTAFGALMQLLISLQPADARSETMWSGPLTIFAFLSGVLNVSLALSLLIALRRPRAPAVLLACANVVLTFPIAFVELRREEMILFLFMLAASLWFARRVVVPATAVVAGACALSVVIFAIADLRSAASMERAETGHSWGLLSLGVLSTADLAHATPWKDTNAPSELRNAAHVMGYVEATGDYSYGADTWNAAVFQYVPAQFLGKDFKDSLMVGGSLSQSLWEYGGYRLPTGVTVTGFASAFHEFGWFGAAIFGLIGYSLGRVWIRAAAEDFWAQALYMSLVGLALLSFTHYAGYLFVEGPLIVGAVVGVRRLAGIRSAQRAPAEFQGAV